MRCMVYPRSLPHDLIACEQNLALLRLRNLIVFIRTVLLFSHKSTLSLAVRVPEIQSSHVTAKNLEVPIMTISSNTSKISSALNKVALLTILISGFLLNPDCFAKEYSFIVQPIFKAGKTMRIYRPLVQYLDRKSVVQGKSVDLGGRRIIKKKINI